MSVFPSLGLYCGQKILTLFMLYIFHVKVLACLIAFISCLRREVTQIHSTTAQKLQVNYLWLFIINTYHPGNILKEDYFLN